MWGPPVASFFPLVDRHTGIRLGVDLSSVDRCATVVVESERRLTAELSYGFVHALWWVWLRDGRSVLSVPPGVSGAVQEAAWAARSGEDLLDPVTAEALREAADPTLTALGLPTPFRVFRDRTFAFAIGPAHFRRHTAGRCVRLTDSSIPPADGLGLPTHCFIGGVAYGVVADGRVVCVAYAHRSGVMESQVADLGVETAPEYRGRGYAKTAVSELVLHFIKARGEARYACDPANTASIRTAVAVGFVPYGTSLVLAAAATGDVAGGSLETVEPGA
jgi:RimJ/RimL family protein N-acetyltransferase